MLEVLALNRRIKIIISQNVLLFIEIILSDNMRTVYVSFSVVTYKLNGNVTTLIFHKSSSILPRLVGCNGGGVNWIRSLWPRMLPVKQKVTAPLCVSSSCRCVQVLGRSVSRGFIGTLCWI